ncbi:MAG: hypothetical protein H8D32_06990 [Dehalococcoidia bacterium]|nr:hypothetical protein [Dehalococcoidia bacterium]
MLKTPSGNPPHCHLLIPRIMAAAITIMPIIDIATQSAILLCLYNANRGH